MAKKPKVKEVWKMSFRISIGGFLHFHFHVKFSGECGDARHFRIVTSNDRGGKTHFESPGLYYLERVHTQEV